MLYNISITHKLVYYIDDMSVSSDRPSLSSFAAARRVENHIMLVHQINGGITSLLLMPKPYFHQPNYCHIIIDHLKKGFSTYG